MGAEKHSKTVRERHYSSHFLRAGEETLTRHFLIGMLSAEALSRLLVSKHLQG